MSTPLAAPPAMKTILVVDDTPENLTVLGELLRPQYRVRVAATGARALQVAASDPKPDLILLDVMMPEMDGYEVIRRLRADATTHDIPVIFVTAMDGAADEERGLQLGAVDYIAKPIKPAIVLARVAAHLELKQARDSLKNQNVYLEAEVERRMRDNQLIQDVSIRTLAGLAEARDLETGNHIRRTQAYVEVLVRALQAHPRHAAALPEALARMVIKSAPLHDIGKVGIPDQILLKPGKLTRDEFEIMKTHSQIGSDAIEKAMRDDLGQVPATSDRLDLETPLAFLAVARDIALRHHEKWDGSGYPSGLAGEAIPLPARIMALSDVFDALTSRRVYKPPFPIDQAIGIIHEGRGRHFDPDVADAFDAHLARFQEIAEHLADSEEDLAEKLHRVESCSVTSPSLRALDPAAPHTHAQVPSSPVRTRGKRIAQGQWRWRLGIRSHHQPDDLECHPLRPARLRHCDARRGAGRLVGRRASG